MITFYKVPGPKEHWKGAKDTYFTTYQQAYDFWNHKIYPDEYFEIVKMESDENGMFHAKEVIDSGYHT